jgi:hypothetical protein
MKRALVLSLIFALGLGFAGLAAELSGSWDTDVTIDPQQVSFADAITLTSVLTVNYTIGDWTFGSVTTLNEDGWVDQTFSAGGVLGAFALTSALDLDPDALFDEWVTTAAVSIAGVSFGAEFTLDGTDAWLTLTAGGVAGDVTIDVEINFGDDDDECDFPFSDVTIDVGFPFCCADISAAIVFDCAGFDNICFSVGGIAIPNLPWVTIGAELCFTLQTKTLTLSPAFDFGTIACFDLYFDVATTGNLTIGDISIVGIGITCDIGAVTFSGLSELPGGDLVDAPYWEVYTISTNDDACCGPFSFDLSVYFLEGGVALFDVGLFEANMELQVAAQFLFNMGLEINVETGAFTSWTVGFLVTW